MDNNKEKRVKRKVIHQLHLHLVFVTKYRKKVFSAQMYESMKYYFDHVCKKFGCNLIECNGEDYHVHLLIVPLPHTMPSRLVNSIKGVSSRKLKSEYPELKQFYWKSGLWSPSYFIASCGGAQLSIIKEYIQNQ
ncbi:MAG: IS200/IS605 family transposase [Cyclobacteriaceae bacterium]